MIEKENYTTILHFLFAFCLSLSLVFYNRCEIYNYASTQNEVISRDKIEKKTTHKKEDRERVRKKRDCTTKWNLVELTLKTPLNTTTD